MDRITRWVVNASVTGLAISLFAHAVFLLLSHFIEFGGAGAPSAGRPEAPPVEVAIMTQAELVQLQSQSFQIATPAAPETPVPEVAEIELLDAAPADALATEAIDLGDLGGTLGAGDVGLDAGLGAGDSSGSATFFGAEAQGSRFCYIVDTSGSMALVGKIESLKNELIRSLASLFEDADFFTVSYAGTATPLGARTKWTEASDRGKAWARKHIAALVPAGSTNPLPAFELAFSIRPRPDAIYFMTDGEFDEAIADEIIAKNRRTEIKIHTITFVNDEAAPYMRRIARESGGTYHHVPGP